MAIRTRAYRGPVSIDGELSLVDLRAVRITEKNWEQVATWVDRNGGEADASSFTTKDGDILDHKITIKQWCSGATWRKRAKRVARVGDFIVRFPDGTFARFKADFFEENFQLIK